MNFGFRGGGEEARKWDAQFFNFRFGAGGTRECDVQPFKCRIEILAYERGGRESGMRNLSIFASEGGWKSGMRNSLMFVLEGGESGVRNF